MPSNQQDMIHCLQLQIAGIWVPFFFISYDNLAENCELYRELRAYLQQAGIQYPCRLKRVSINVTNDVLKARDKYPQVSDLINAFCDEKVATGKWEGVKGDCS